MVRLLILTACMFFSATFPWHIGDFCHALPCLSVINMNSDFVICHVAKGSSRSWTMVISSSLAHSAFSVICCPLWRTKAEIGFTFLMFSSLAHVSDFSLSLCSTGSSLIDSKIWINVRTKLICVSWQLSADHTAAFQYVLLLDLLNLWRGPLSVMPKIFH